MVFRQSLGRIWRRGRATQREHGEGEGEKGRLNIQSYCDSRKANKVLLTCFLCLIKLALLTKGLVLAGPKRKQSHTLKQPPLEQSRSNLQKQEKVTLWGSEQQKRSHPVSISLLNFTCCLIRLKGWNIVGAKLTAKYLWTVLLGFPIIFIWLLPNFPFCQRCCIWNSSIWWVTVETRELLQFYQPGFPLVFLATYESKEPGRCRKESKSHWHMDWEHLWITSF